MIVKSGLDIGAIGVLGVIVPELLAVTVSFGTVAAAPLIIGLVPAVPANGVIGIVNAVLFEPTVAGKPAAARRHQRYDHKDH